MKRIPAQETALAEALDVLKARDGVLLAPTETVYGLLCAADHEAACERIYRLKRRPASKQLANFIPSVEFAESFLPCGLPETAVVLAKKFCPGPVTLVVPDGQGGTYGFRIPDHPFVLALLKAFNGAVASTSANLSGMPAALSVDDALGSLDGEPDLAVDGGLIPADSLASTVIQVFADNTWKILRPGPVAEEQIAAALNTCNLTKFLSTAGVASRRKSAELIKAGKVRVNGEIILDPSRRVSDADSVVCDGQPVRCHAGIVRHYIMLHKPRGYVCTSSDMHAEKKALDLIRTNDGARLFSAGRLDKDSEGMILFSDDGDFVNSLTHPRNEVEKTYEVSVDSPLSREHITRMLNGIADDGDILRAKAVARIGDCKYKLVLGEGKNREIRRMMNACGRKTKRLKRVAVGKLRLGGLKCGEWRELTPEECRAALQPRDRR